MDLSSDMENTIMTTVITRPKTGTSGLLYGTGFGVKNKNNAFYKAKTQIFQYKFLHIKEFLGY